MLSRLKRIRLGDCSREQDLGPGVWRKTDRRELESSLGLPRSRYPKSCAARAISRPLCALCRDRSVGTGANRETNDRSMDRDRIITALASRHLPRHRLILIPSITNDHFQVST